MIQLHGVKVYGDPIVCLCGAVSRTLVEHETHARRARRAAALDTHARLVYDADRDIAGEFSDE